MLYFVSAILMAILGLQYAYWHLDALTGSALHGLHAVANALANPATVSPVLYCMLIAAIAAAFLMRGLIYTLSAFGLVLVVPVTAFIMTMSAVNPPKANASYGVGVIQFQDWTGMITKKMDAKSRKQAVVDSVFTLTSNTSSIAYCARLVDTDTIDRMPGDCQVIACDRLENGSIETDPLTRATDAARVGQPRRHGNLAGSCRSVWDVK